MTDVRERLAQTFYGLECNVDGEAAWGVISDVTKDKMRRRADIAMRIIGDEIVKLIPGGSICDPQAISDMVREITGARDD